MKRSIVALLALFLIANLAAQFVTLDGKQVVFKRAKGDSAAYYDLRTGAHVRTVSTEGRDLNSCSFFLSRFFPNGCMQTLQYEHTTVMAHDAEGKWRNVPLTLAKYLPERGYEDVITKRYYLHAVPAKDRSCSKLPGRLYAVDATSTEWTLLAEFPFGLPRFMVKGDLLLTEKGTLYRIANNTLTQVFEHAGTALCFADSLVAYLEEEDDRTPGGKYYARAEVWNWQRDQVVSSVTTPKGPLATDTSHYYRFGGFTPDLSAYFLLGPNDLNPYDARVVLARNTFTHHLFARYGSRSDIASDSLEAESTAITKWVWDTRQHYQDSLDRAAATWPARTSTVGGKPCEAYGAQHFDAYMKQITDSIQRDDWALLASFDKSQWASGTPRYLFNRMNWVYKVVVAVTDPDGYARMIATLSDKDQPDQPTVGVKYVDQMYLKMEDARYPGVLLASRNLRTAYTFDALLGVPDKGSSRWQVLVFATPERSFLQGRYSTTSITQRDQLITGKGDERDEVREEQERQRRLDAADERYRREHPEADPGVCGKCGGMGIVYGATPSCTACQGSGSVKCTSCVGGYRYKDNGRGGKQSEYCYRCHGSGKTFCYSCGGTGHRGQGAGKACTVCGGDGRTDR